MNSTRKRITQKLQFPTKKALEKNSAYKKASYNMGNAFYQEKNYKEAIPQYELTVKTAKDKTEKAEAFHNMGNAHIEGKNYQVL